MTLIKVNGVALAVTPATCQVDRMDLASSDSGRTLSGEAIKKTVSKKVKISLTFSAIPWDKLSDLLSQVEVSDFISITYPDPKYGTFKTSSFYVSDRTSPMAMVTETDDIVWNGVAFDFIQE